MDVLHNHKRLISFGKNLVTIRTKTDTNLIRRRLTNLYQVLS